MRVLHIMSSCSRGSGVAQVIMRYFRQVYRQVTFDFLVYWESEESMREEIESLGGRVFVIPQPGLRTMKHYARQFDCFLSDHEGEYAAVHLHELYLNVLYFPIAKRHGIEARIVHAHTTRFSEYWLNDIRNRVLFFPVRWLATHYVACTGEAGEAIFGRYVCRHKRFLVLKNASDLTTLTFRSGDREAVREEFGLQDKFVLGHVGRFSPQKNHSFLLEVFAEVCKQRSDAALLLVGAGGLMEEAGKKARDLGVFDRVIFTGSRSDVGRILSAMDVFVLPSVFEGLGIALVEAQSNGLPCVASDVVPGDAWILPSACRVSLKTGPEAWARVILGCDLTRDAQAVEKVGAAGYDISAAADRLVAFYNTL